MSAPLSDLTVLEHSGDVATRYCGRLFAALGARVVSTYRPDNAGLGYGGAAGTAYAAWLDEGKETMAALPALAPDLVIAGQTPAEVVDAAANWAPRGALLLGLTWFAPAGPYAGWRGSDGIIQALSGVAYGFGPAEGPPCLPQGHAPQVVGGVTAFIAGLAALYGRRGGRATGRVDVNIPAAFLCLSESAGAGAFQGAPASVRRGVNRFGPVYPQTIFPATNGWIGITALTPQQWEGLCALIGLPELARDPRYATTDLRLAASYELDALLAPAFARMSVSYLVEEGQRRRLPLAPVPSMAEVLAMPHWCARNSFSRIEAKPGFDAPSLPFRLHHRPIEDAGQVRAAQGDGPLAGVRVLDLSMGWSGPLATRHFADLGAEVIKVEGTGHLDWWRGWNALEAGDPPPYETRPNFNAVNRNKRGITLDLRSPRGVALLKGLAAKADLLVENYAPGVLDKLGLGAAVIAGLNPRLGYISMGAFGSVGPWSGFRAYGSTTEQAAGMPFLHGEADWPPAMQHTAYGDPIAGLYAAAALLAALWGRERLGAATIDLSQVECLFQLAADGTIAQSAIGAPPPRTGSRRVAGHWRGCVRAAGADAWLAVDLPDAADAARLAPLVGGPDGLAAWATARPAPEAAATLQAAGIAAAPVVPATSLLADPQLEAAGYWIRLHRRHVGEHVVPKPPYAFDGKPPPVRTPAPTLGEHTAEVLGALLGLTDEDIAELEREGVSGTRAA